jgi:peptide/nickel transport system substrate-binding protein
MVYPPRRTWKSGVALVATAAVALTLSACSASADVSGESGTGEDQELSLAIVSAPGSFDPAQLDDGQSSFVWNGLFDGLIYRENETGDLKPWAAESWEYSEDGLSLTFDIREGMTFSTGDPVTAESYAATMRRTMETPGAQQGKFVNVSSITAPDDRTLQIDFTAFDPAFLPTVASAIGVAGDPATMDEERTATDPVGSGPYVLDTAQTVPGTSYVLERRDDYWNLDAVPFETVKVTVLQDPTASFNALQSGEVNAASVRAQQLGAIEGNDAFTIRKVEAQAIGLLNIFDRAGEKFPELGDVRVRQAMSYAIDREGILTSLLGGAGSTTQQVFNPLSPVYDDSLNDTYSYDPEKAKELLAEAGYAAGFTLQIPSTFVTTAFEPTLSQQMADIGITLEWIPVPPQQAASVTQSGLYGVTFQIIGFNSHQSSARAFYGEGGFDNPYNYSDATLSGLFDEIDRTVDPEAAVPIYQELNEYVVEQALVVPVINTGISWATRDGVEYLDNGASGIASYRLFGVAE